MNRTSAVGGKGIEVTLSRFSPQPIRLETGGPELPGPDSTDSIQSCMPL